AMQFLRVFALAGGKLIALGQLPVHSSDQRDDPRLASLLADLRVQNRLTFAETPSAMSETEWLRLLRPLLDELQPADLSIDAPFAHDVIVQHRVLDDGHLYFIANLSAQEGDALISLRL